MKINLTQELAGLSIRDAITHLLEYPMDIYIDNAYYGDQHHGEYNLEIEIVEKEELNEKINTN